MVVRVLIADDQAVVRAGFRMILDSQPDIEVVAEAPNGARAVALAGSLSPDVVLMDVRMPDLDGIAATRAIAGTPGAHPAVLVVTTFDLDEYVFGAIAAGASGFLLKDVSPGLLVEAVRTIAAGDAVVAPRATQRLVREYASTHRRLRTEPRLDLLTERETDVLGAVARGLSNAEIAAELHLSEATVKTHVSRMLGKLELRSRTQAVVLAYETGVARAGSGPGS